MPRTFNKNIDTPIESGLEWVAQNTILIENEEKATKLFKLIDSKRVMTSKKYSVTMNYQKNYIKNFPTNTNFALDN